MPEHSLTLWLECVQGKVHSDPEYVRMHLALDALNMEATVSDCVQGMTHPDPFVCAEDVCVQLQVH